MDLAFYFDLWMRILQFLIVVVIALAFLSAYYEVKNENEHKVKNVCGNSTEE